MNEKPALNGLILAGGKSSRMGFDKSLIEFHNKPQREVLFDLLKKYCKEVYLSCKNVTAIPETLNPLPDQYDMDSPLNGILSAFKKESSCAWLMVAVDMPFIDDVALQFLTDRRDPEKTATCFLDSDEKLPEPLFTIWEPKAYDLLKDFHARGNISPRSFLQHHDIKLLDIPDKKTLMNINSQEELKKVKGFV